MLMPGRIEAPSTKACFIDAGFNIPPEKCHLHQDCTTAVDTQVFNESSDVLSMFPKPGSSILYSLMLLKLIEARFPLAAAVIKKK